MALPVLAGLAGWAVSDEGLIRFVDSAGMPLLAFRAGADGRHLVAEHGEVAHVLTPQDRTRAVRASEPRPPPGPRPLPNALAARPAQPLLTPDAASVPGRYGMARRDGRIVCHLSLDRGAAPGSGAARLDGACPDQGITVFDPVRWRYADGRLVLVARRGHELGFASARAGFWRKEPETGATLTLERP
jgi:hypothetical protein